MLDVSSMKKLDDPSCQRNRNAASAEMPSRASGQRDVWLGSFGMLASAMMTDRRIPDAYRQIADFYDELAPRDDEWVRKVDAYRELVHGVYSTLIPPGHRVLEIGSARGDLLATLRPSRGVGVDVSEAMVAVARDRYPELEFVHGVGED